MKREIAIAKLIDETILKMGAHSHVQMSEGEKAFINEHFEPITVKKGEHVVNKGEEVLYLYYLEKGNIKLWFPDKENREITAKFVEEKEFINFFLSHNTHYAYYNVKALSPYKIWRMEKSKLHDFYNLSFSFNKLARIHLERSIIHKIERENGFHTLSAEERYKRLLETERWLLQYFSLKDIASYLGITPQALSNVRKRI